jgi:hypothetical protein
MKTKFLSACLGVAAVICSVAFLIRSASPANATPTPEEFVQQGTDKIGKYQMMLSAENASYYEIVFIWDTETGTSTRYVKKPTGYEKATLQLPASPM